MAITVHSKKPVQKETDTMGSVQEIRPAAAPVTSEKWVDGGEVAEHVGCSRNHIISLARRKIIRGRNLGHGKKQFWRFRISEVDQDIEKMHQQNEENERTA